jgi:hypothetical protein
VCHAQASSHDAAEIQLPEELAMAFCRTCCNHDKFINKVCVSVVMATETVCIPVEEYQRLKKKAHIADDVLLQLEASLRDLEAGRIKRVR